MKKAIAQSKQDITDAKARQDEAAKEVKRIEKDMKEFSSNKDSKLAELQQAVEKLRSVLQKSSIAIKPLQQEMRDANLESEQCGGDLSGAKESLEEAEGTLKAQNEEIASLGSEQDRVKVRCYYMGLRGDKLTVCSVLMTSPKPSWTMRGPS